MKYILPVLLIILALAIMVCSPLIVKHGKAFMTDVMANFKSYDLTRNKQAGFVTLLRAYGGYPVSQIVQLPKSTEDALIAASLATTHAGPPTTGAVTTSMPGGACAIAAGASSVVITNPLVTAQTLIWACVSQAAADGTLLRVERVVAAAGSFTIYGTANATATTVINWAILSPFGNLTGPT